MRVAHFIHRYPPALGGAEAWFARLSQFLAVQGEEVTVFTTTALDLTAFWSPQGKCLPAGVSTDANITIRRYPLWRMHGRRWLLKPLSLISHRQWQCLTLPCNPISRHMWRDVHQLGVPFDVVHATAFPYAFPIICAMLLARRLRVPFFVTPFLHLGNPDDANDPTRRAYTSAPLLWLLRQADGVFVQTVGERKFLHSQGFRHEKIILQGLGVDAHECAGGNRRQMRASWGISPETVVIGHLANNSEEKGTVDLLRAAAINWDEGMEFRVVLAGPEMPNFLSFWKSFRHKNKVKRLGCISNQEKRCFYAAIDVFALPSRSDSFGLVLLEAWANKKPNLAYRAGGVADVIQHGKDGLLVACGNIAGLSERLRQLILDPALRNRLGVAGHRRTLTEFVWDDKLHLIRSTYAKRIAPDLELSQIS